MSPFTDRENELLIEFLITNLDYDNEISNSEASTIISNRRRAFRCGQARGKTSPVSFNGNCPTLTTRRPSSPTLSAAHAARGVKESRK